MQVVGNMQSVHVTAGVVAPHSAQVGKQVQEVWPHCSGDFRLYGTLSHALQQCDPTHHVVLDFSVADACENHLQACQQHHVAYVTGVTGLQSAQYQALQQTAQTVPVLHASNMSLGVNVLRVLCCLASQLLPEADIEILDLHHRVKRDHPSGTALWLARQMAKSRGWSAEDCINSQPREGIRNDKEIGIASLRGGDERGQHTIHLLLQDEALQLTHRTASRAVYAQGALLACQYIVQQPAGLYNMQDVLKKFLHKNLQNIFNCL